MIFVCHACRQFWSGFVALNWKIKDINMVNIGHFRDIDDNSSCRKQVKNNLTGASYTDTAVDNDTNYWYQLEVTDDVSINRQNEVAAAAFSNASLVVSSYANGQKEIIAYLKPMNLDTITINIPEKVFNEFTVFGISGRLNQLGSISPGSNELRLNISDFANRVYMILLK